MHKTATFTFNESGAFASLGPYSAQVRGNHITAYEHTRDRHGIAVTIQHDHDLHSYGDFLYPHLEGMLRRAGEGARLGYTIYDQAGAILHFYDARPQTAITTAEFPDRDPDDLLGYYDGGCFGYSFNLDCDYCSEWGTAPFPEIGQTDEQRNANIAASLKALSDAFGGDITIIETGDTLLARSDAHERE